MKTIILASCMIRYPFGGMTSYVLQYLLGLKRLGYDVYFVEKANYHNACYDMRQNTMTDDPSYGIEVVTDLLNRFGLGKKWCYIDVYGNHFGMNKFGLTDIFRHGALFIDMGVHGALAEESKSCALRVLLDGEPGYTQIKMEKGVSYPEYDAYYTNGLNIGLSNSSAPTAGRQWNHIIHPVVTDLHTPVENSLEKNFTTIMNWQSHQKIEYNGILYGQKDIEFQKFLDLPSKVSASLEIAVAPGPEIPRNILTDKGWMLKSAHHVTASYESFVQYINSSLGEFSVCKNIFVSTNSGWFSDRSAAYLAMSKPVVLQDTGYSEHLPVGEGLFAFKTIEEAVQSIEKILSDPVRHGRAARKIACEYLDTSVVLKKFLSDLGL